MSAAVTAEAPVRRRSGGNGAVAGVLAGALALCAALALIDLTQGTAAVGPVELWNVFLGSADQDSAAVVMASRLPRMLAGIVVGLALGVAGAALQSISRNVLASPDTLAVNAGAYFALGIASVTGFTLPLLASSAVAFVGGLAAAAVVLGLSGLGTGALRLVLAGSALALGLGSMTSALLLLYPQATEGLYQWGQGSISQGGTSGVVQVAPLLVVGLAGLLLLGRRMDALGLGDDAARSLGVNVRSTRVGAVLLAVLLSAAAVTLAGPIGFVGLCAPALVRPLANRVQRLGRAVFFLPLAGLMGANLILASDVALRAVVGADASVRVPTGVITSLVGAVFLIVLAFRAKDSGSVTPTDHHPLPPRWRYLLTVAVLAAVALAVLAGSLLLGDAKLLLGDVLNWLAGESGKVVGFVLDTRAPRVAAAMAAGAALALAGTLIQSITRNPLAEPGLLGVSGGAGLAAVLVVSTVPLVSPWGISLAALAGAALAAALVFGLAARGGYQQNRLVLIGVGVSAGTLALVSLVIVLTDPFNATKALTWLAGSTYGRTFLDVLPLAAGLLVFVPMTAFRHRELDILSLDEDTPRLLGVPLARARLLFLVVSVILTALSIAAVGAVGFVGLIAPHAARALVGRRHTRVLPTAILLGAILVGAADVLGRTVIAPAQLGAGLLTAVLGTPYFICLLWRSRARQAG